MQYLRPKHRIFSIAAAFCAGALAAGPAPAAEPAAIEANDIQPADAAAPDGAAAPTESAETEDSLPAPKTATGKRPAGERWRYKFHEGRWWYWLPSRRWVIWNGSRWTDYHPTVALPPSSATWNDPSFGARLDWSHFSKLSLSPTGESEAALGAETPGHAWTRAPLGEPYSPLARARAMPGTSDAVLERSRWSLSVSANERTLEQSFWPRSFYFNNWGYYSPGYYSPLYRHRYLPAPVGQFNYATSAAGYLGGALTPGMANGFLNRWP